MSLDNLPVEWLLTSIENISEVIAGGTPKANDPENFVEPPNGIGWLTPADLSGYSHKYIGHGKRDLSEKGYKSSSAKLIPKGSVVFSSRAPIGYVAIASNEISTNQGFKNFVIDENISSEYLYYYLKRIRDLAESLGTGTTFKELSGSACKKLPFVLAPLVEQQEIVRQLDVMLAQVEQIKARLDAIPAILKKFRQSVLVDAVSGRLTEDTNFSKWIKSTIGTEFKCIDGDRGKNYPKKEDYQTEGYCLFLSTKNVRKFGFLFDEKVFISEQKHQQLRNGTLQRNDLIITTRGTLGHVASYDKNVPFDVVRINSGMLILRKIKQNLLNEFMMLLLASPNFQRIIEEQRTGSAQPQLPAKILKEFEIELPSLDEQKIIVQKVESYFKLIEKTEKTVQSAQKRVNLLTQSILAKAFSGELTAEWREQHQELITGVNSAESLLAKIQAEREVSKPVKKVKKVK